MGEDKATRSTREQRAERNIETRNRLLDGAIRIASQRGIDKVTSRAVGMETGLSHGLVRFYFGTVDEMITSALDRAAHLDAAEGPLLAADLDEFGSLYASSLSANPSRAVLQYDYLLRAIRGGLPVERVVELYDFYQSQVTGTLHNVDVPDPDGATAALVFAALDGLVLQHSIYGSSERTNLILDRLREVLGLLRDNGATTATAIGPRGSVIGPGTRDHESDVSGSRQVPN